MEFLVSSLFECGGGGGGGGRELMYFPAWLRDVTLCGDYFCWLYVHCENSTHFMNEHVNIM